MTKYKKGHIPWSKGKHPSLETRKKISEARKGIKFSKETKKKLSEALRGERSYNYGRHLSKKTRGKISKAHLGKRHSEETKKKISEHNTRYWLGKHRPPVSKETREKIRQVHLGKKLTKKHIRSVLRRRKKSSLEIRVDDVIKKYRLPYKFVGNGKFFIERKNPDFVNINGEKIAVEVFCRKHKDLFREGGCEQWKMERSAIFKRYGWEIIFIEEWQTNTESSIVSLLSKYEQN